MQIPDYQQSLKRYYKLHAPIYDATRWSFLFGRHRLFTLLPPLPEKPQILEIGCGTGSNLKYLHRLFPDAQLTGIDLSDDMLRKADKKLPPSSSLRLINSRYGPDIGDAGSFDLIVLSYSLTMMGPQLESVLQQAARDISPKGYIAVVDFHTTPYNWFKRWMHANHVQMNGSLLPLLKENFTSSNFSIHPVYGGLWAYFLFVGRPETSRLET